MYICKICEFSPSIYENSQVKYLANSPSISYPAYANPPDQRISWGCKL